MRWTRDLTRICFFAAVIWILVVVTALWTGCFESPLSPVCEVGANLFDIPIEKELSDFNSADWVSWMELAAWPPLALISLGYILSLLMRAFGRGNPR